MEITVNCGCGSNYSFTEEPVNGRLRFPVSCPNCGTDGTMSANEFIRKSLSGELRSEDKAHDEQGHEKTGPIRFLFGVLGAFAGGALGLAIWYSIERWTGLEVGFVAVGVGALAGLGARLAVPGGSFGLAGVSSLAAVCAISGGQYLVRRDFVENELKTVIVVAHMGMVQYADAAVKAESDDDIRKVLIRFGYDPRDLASGESAVLSEKRHMLRLGLIFGRMMEPGSVLTLHEVVRAREEREEPTAADIALFRQRELPQLKEFLNGKPTTAEFSATLNHIVHSRLSPYQILLQSWSPYLLLWLALGVGSAYRIAYNRSETEDI